MATQAVPEHTIIRFRACRPDTYGRLVRPARWRFFVNATHAEVTGDPVRGGADWVNQWSCEELTEGGEWRINGRGEWPTPAALEAALVKEYEGEPYFATYEEARDRALEGLRRARHRAEELAAKLTSRIDVLVAQAPPILPP